MNRYKVTCKGRSVKVFADSGWKAIRSVADGMGERLDADAEIVMRKDSGLVCKQRIRSGGWAVARQQPAEAMWP